MNTKDLVSCKIVCSSPEERNRVMRLLRVNGLYSADDMDGSFEDHPNIDVYLDDNEYQTVDAGFHTNEVKSEDVK